jgi:hypothetical protein
MAAELRDGKIHQETFDLKCVSDSKRLSGYGGVFALLAWASMA